MRTRYVWRDGDWRQPLPRPPRKGPMLISDALPETRSQIDGRVFDSRSAYYRHVRETGHEIVGNERLSRTEDPAITEKDIRESAELVAAGKGYTGSKAPEGWEDE